MCAGLTNPGTERVAGKVAAVAPSIVILGAGFGGLAAGMQLKRAGIDSFKIIEKAARLGGTWRDNTYPGCGCDVPSHLYCYSFEPNPNWSRKFPKQPEILRYLESCAEKHGINEHIQYNTEIAKGAFDAKSGRWTLTTASGESLEADIVISATGQLNRPSTPSFPGQDEFTGAQFHSAQWNHRVSLAGQRVGVVGNGASAIQFIPEIVPAVQHLTIFQRSANWMVEKPDRRYLDIERFAFRHIPGARRLHRYLIYAAMEARALGFKRDHWANRHAQTLAENHLCEHVKDPTLREHLTPDFPVGCKRILISNEYYQSIQRRNVSVNSQGVQNLTKTGVTTTDGAHHELDTLIYATGFESTRLLAPMEFEGLDGRRLSEAWRAGAEAYRGIAVAGFPNLFIVYGPNTNLGHNSIVFMIECQLRSILQLVKRLAQGRARYVDVRADAMSAYNTAIQRRLAETVWAAECGNWYKNEAGKITNNWPGFTLSYWRQMRTINDSDWNFSV